MRLATNRLGWVARLVAAPIVLLFAIFFIGEGIFGPEPLWQAEMPAGDWLRLATLGVALVGLLLAFFRPRAGGVLAVAAMVVWLAMEHLTGPNAPKMPQLDLWPFYLVLMAGVLFWISGRKATRREDEIAVA
jgi:hypothetical protein